MTAPIVTTFTTSGTWTPNVATSTVLIFAWNGGSGGGSGRRGLSGAASGGGSGGASSCLLYTGSIASFGASETVTVGAGGIGGLSQTVNSTNGNIGSSGGVTSIGNISVQQNSVRGPFTYGAAGTSTLSDITIGLSGLFYNIKNFDYTITNPTMIASTGNNISGSNGTDLLRQSTINLTTSFSVTGIVSLDPLQTTAKFMCPTNGGGGGGAHSTIRYSGGNGGSIYPLNDTSASDTPVIAGGIGGNEAISINGGAGNPGITSNHGFVLGGTGGGGAGGQSQGSVAGIGGAGGEKGGSGGGGGGSLNGTNSGAGGVGGNGKVIIIEYL